MKKQVLCGLLVLCLIFSLLPVSAIADTAKSGTCGENLTWTLDSEGTLTISGTGAMTDYSDESKAPWFNSRSSIKSATIGNSVTSIGVEAFYDCDVLTKVTIPDSVTSIGGRAFCGCDGLTSVTIGNSVTSIEYSAFSFCSSLASVTIPDSVTSIGVEAFRGCSSLASVTIPDSVTSIGEGAFSDCDGLTSVTIPNSVTTIGESAFSDCDGLTSVTIGNGVTSIGDYAFFCCLSLASVTIPDSVTSIGNSAFEFCRSLTSVTIPDSVTSIGDRAFYYCTGLTEINYNAKAVTDLTSSSNVFTETGTAGSGIKVTFGEKVKKVPDYLFSTRFSSDFPSIREIVFLGNAPTIGSKSFNGVETSAYYPYGNDTWTSEVMKGYGGQITWKPYSEAEAVSVVCNGKTSYVVGDELEINSISVTIERSDGCVETYYYDSGKITLGEYDMSKSGKQSITVTCRGVTAQLNIYIHDLTSETMPANDYPESSHNYEDNLDKTYTYTADGAYSLDVTFSNETEAETNIDYIYVNGTTYTGKELANKTLHINGDTLTVRLVSDGSDGAYGFSIDSIVATYLVHEYTDTVVAPTCTEKGYTIHTCACGESHVDSYVDALGHSFGEWTVTTAPTCTEKGVETRYCSRCDATETRDVDALGHALVHHDGKAATCTEAGWEAYDTCSRCDYTTYKVIPATGHSYTSVVTEPTCTEQGYTTHTCACGDSYVADYKDALGHSYGAWTQTKAPTCTAKGTEDRTCTRCNAVQTRDVAALGHSYKNGKCVRCGAKNPNYVAAPVLKITTSAGKPQISWNAVDGATKYWIYRSTDGKTFKYYDSTTKTSYTNKSTSIGTTYYYKVKAVKTVDGTNYTSDLSGAKSILCKPAAPTVSIYRTNGKPQLKWSAVTGATKYWIYRSTDGVNFSYYDSTTKTSYTNSGAASGKKYYYRVKAVAVVNGNNVASANSGTKSLMTTLAKPTVSITTSNGKPKITWKAVTGADKYYVYRSTDGKNFSYYDSTTKLSYTNTGAKKNTKYYYKVKAICSANTNANSAYSAVVSIKATK